MVPPRPPLPARIDKAALPRLYARVAPYHDLAARLLESRARDLALTWADIRDGETILDIATGTGLTFEEMLRRNPSGRNVGLDLTEAMLKRARRRTRRYPDVHAELLIGDAYALPFPDASFDLVFNHYMLDLLPTADMPGVLREYRRVLRPTGRIVLVSLAVPRRRVHGLWDLFYRIHPTLLGGCRGIDLLTPAREAGFGNIRQAYITQFTYPSEVLYAEPHETTS